MMDIAVPSLRRFRFILPLFVVAFLHFDAASQSQTQSQAQTERKYPGRGAVSAQDLSKLTSPTDAGTTAADQVCQRDTTGSTITDPPVLQSQGGVLEVTMSFNTVTDSQDWCAIAT